MGHMQWISDMVVNGSFKNFKEKYIKCVLTDAETFDFENKNIAREYGKSVVKYVDNYLLKEYDKHIDIKAQEALMQWR
jgi:hypothetical protein|tara:strand:- start:410 stop:643 length:234 start_codon:yes stop_codon:yes gene_type:complete